MICYRAKQCTSRATSTVLGKVRAIQGGAGRLDLSAPSAPEYVDKAS